MGELALYEQAAPATPNEGVVFYSTVATPSVAMVKDDAGGDYAIALQGKALTGNLILNSFLIIPTTTLTIAGGIVTATRSAHALDTEAAAVSDDLDTILGGIDGAILWLSTVSSSRDVVLKHGTGNIFNLAGADITITSASLIYTYRYYLGNWRQVD